MSMECLPTPQCRCRSTSRTSMTTGLNSTSAASIVWIQVTSLERSWSIFWAPFPSIWRLKIQTGWVEVQSQGLHEPKVWLWVTLTIFPKTPRTQLILEGEDKDVFSVQPESLVSGINVQLQVKQPQNLDYEVKQQMILKVRKTIRSQFVILEALWVDFCDPLVV